MLRISKLMDYGTLVLTHMAAAPTRVFSASELAASLGLGHATVSKILKLLGQSELLLSQRGSRGGYWLARPPEQINMVQIIDALDDQPFGLTECTVSPGTCFAEPDCHMRPNWARINHIIRSTLEGVTVADMLAGVHAHQPVPIHFTAAGSDTPAKQPMSPDMELP